MYVKNNNNIAQTQLKTHLLVKNVNGNLGVFVRNGVESFHLWQEQKRQRQRDARKKEEEQKKEEYKKSWRCVRVSFQLFVGSKRLLQRNNKK